MKISEFYPKMSHPCREAVAELARQQGWEVVMEFGNGEWNLLQCRDSSV